MPTSQQPTPQDPRQGSWADFMEALAGALSFFGRFRSQTSAQRQEATTLNERLSASEAANDALRQDQRPSDAAE